MSKELIERARKLASTGGMRDITIRALADIADKQAQDLAAANASILKLRAEVEEQRARAEIVEQELARIKGAGLPETIGPIIKRHLATCMAFGNFGVVGAEAHADRATLLDAVRVLTAERDEALRIADDLVRRPAEARVLRAESERDSARSGVERMLESNRQLAENAQIATDALLRRTQELSATEEALRIKTAEADTLHKNRDALAHGETEALKMMAAEKQRADRLAEGIANYRQERDRQYELIVVDEWESEHGHLLVPR